MIGKAWKSEQIEVVAKYEEEAIRQQHMRDILLVTPLKSKSEYLASGLPKSEKKAFVHGWQERPELKHFAEKISYQRLQLNFSNLNDSPEVKILWFGAAGYFVGFGSGTCQLTC